MRMPGLTSIFLAAGLVLAGPATAQTEPSATPTTAAGALDAPAATTPPEYMGNTPPVTAAAPLPEAPGALPDPTLRADGSPLLQAAPGFGQPADREIGLQSQVTPTGREAHWFHNQVLLPLIVFISLIVLALLVYVVIRYRRAANPTPSRTAHNTLVEVVWTLVPVLILLAIAVPSIRLLAAQYRPAPDNAVTLKAIGNQWFWSYEYPDHGGVSIVSNMLREQGEVEAGQRYRTDADGPRLLATDNRVVLPVGVPIRLITTATDVIHSWAIPAFWVKLDAVPGRLNETTFTIEQPGLYFGQCSELCGARHAFMPIAVEAVAPEVFAQWIRAKGGTMPEADSPSDAPPMQPGADEGDTTTTPTETIVPNVTNVTIDDTVRTVPVTDAAATQNGGGLGQTDQ